MSINQLNALFGYFMQFYAYFSHFCPLKSEKESLSRNSSFNQLGNK